MNTSSHCRPTYQDWLVALVMPVVETRPASAKLVPLNWLRLMPQPVLMEGIQPEFGKFSQSKMLVYPRFNPTRSLDDAVDVYDVDPETGEVTARKTITDVKNVHVVPNPYKEQADWDEETSNLNPTGRKLYFVNLPEQATIRIYSLGGDLVQTIEHRYDLSPERDMTFWNLVSRNNQEVVSGVYIYHIESPVGEKVGRFVIIR